MYIGVDMDDVLRDFMSHFILYHNRAYETSYTLSQFSSFNLSEILQISKEEETERLKQFYSSPEYLGIPPKDGAIEIIPKIAEKNDLIVISGLPKEERENSLFWINRYFPERFSEAYFIGSIRNNRKSHLCYALGIPLLIEDSLDTAKECSSLGTRVILYDAPWNQTESTSHLIERAHNWKNILEIINSKKLFRI
ncbi:hypothetical protein J4424_04415 [Candidatus Woesearchaeota archaeon]|nr:hypothetical protein [Candidatus Woesearchaeota archaeon]